MAYGNKGIIKNNPLRGSTEKKNFPDVCKLIFDVYICKVSIIITILLSFSYNLLSIKCRW